RAGGAVRRVLRGVPAGRGDRRGHGRSRAAGRVRARRGPARALRARPAAHRDRHGLPARAPLPGRGSALASPCVASDGAPRRARSGAGPGPAERCPEARDQLAALALAAAAEAPSPLAVDLLLDQRRRWAALGAADPDAVPEEHLADGRALGRLLRPPVVATL